LGSCLTGRIVLDHRQPDPARSLAHDLDRARDQELAFVRAPGLGHDRRVLGAKGQAGLVDLDQAGERLPPRIDHGPTQLAQQQPGRLVAAEPELKPQLPGRDAILVGRHQPGRQEPEPERQVAPVQHRARGHRGLAMTLPALDQQQAAAQLPALVVAATGAAETVRPALLEQPSGTGRVIRKLHRESRQRPRPISHPDHKLWPRLCQRDKRCTQMGSVATRNPAPRRPILGQR
jgi:hypothetical protein